MFTSQFVIILLLFLVLSSISIETNITNELLYPNIPRLLTKRQNIPILNKFKLNEKAADDGTSEGDYHVVVYYITSSDIQIIIRRFDNLYWSKDLILQINDITTTDYEIIIISSNTKSSYEGYHHLTNVSVIPNLSIYQSQNIPKIIMQTAASYQSKNEYHWNAYMSFVELNPEYKLMLYVDEDCRQLIKNFFPSKVLDAYDQLVPTAFKADLFRYCFLYIYGGCYFDNKMIARYPLRDLLSSNHDLILCSDTQLLGTAASSLSTTSKIYNAVMCSKPGDKRLLHVIEYVIGRINERFYPMVNYYGSDLTVTGPTALYNAIRNYINESNVPMKHGRIPYSSEYKDKSYLRYYIMNKLTNSIIFTKYYKNYYDKSSNNKAKTHLKGGIGGNYHEQWSNHEVYYDNPLWYNNFKILFHIKIKEYYDITLYSNSTIILYKKPIWNVLNVWTKDESIDSIIVPIYCQLPIEWINENIQPCNNTNIENINNYYLTAISIINDITNKQIVIPINIPNNKYINIILNLNLNK